VVQTSRILLLKRNHRARKKKPELDQYAEDALFNVVIVLLLLAGAVLGVCM
jgi:hypothetical protein